MRHVFRTHKKVALVLSITAVFANGCAFAGDEDIRAQIRELAQKLEALQKLVAESKTMPTEVPAQAPQPVGFKVSLFGNIDAAYGRQGNIAPAGSAVLGATSKIFNGGWAPSSFGVSGSVDFGDGLAGIFRLDSEFLTASGANVAAVSGQTVPSGYNGANGSSVLFNRAAYGGLSSRFGTVIIGRQPTVAVDAVAKVEPSDFVDFWMSAVYGAFNLGNAIYGQGLVNTAAGKYSAGVSGNLDSRDNAMIKYTSPDLYGFKIVGGYSPGAFAGDDSAGSKGAVGVSYDDGPFSLGGSYTEWNPVDAVSNVEKKYKLSNFGIGYKTGGFSVRAALGRTSLPAVTLKDSTNTNVAYSAATASVYGIGGTYSVTPKVDLIAAYYSKKYDIKAGSQPKVTTLGFGGSYLFYRNAKLYALYDNARSGGDNAADQTLGGHSSASAFAVGFSYGFSADFSR